MSGEEEGEVQAVCQVPVCVIEGFFIPLTGFGNTVGDIQVSLMKTGSEFSFRYAETESGYG